MGSDYYHTIMWMQEAYDRVKDEKISNQSTVVVLDYLQFSMYKVCCVVFYRECK